MNDAFAGVPQLGPEVALTVAIPARNEESAIAATLTALARQRNATARHSRTDVTMRSSSPTIVMTRPSHARATSLAHIRVSPCTSSRDRYRPPPHTSEPRASS